MTKKSKSANDYNLKQTEAEARALLKRFLRRDSDDTHRQIEGLARVIVVDAEHWQLPGIRASDLLGPASQAVVLYAASQLAYHTFEAAGLELHDAEYMHLLDDFDARASQRLEELATAAMAKRPAN